MKVIYETELINGKKILTEDLQEIVDTINESGIYKNTIRNINNKINKVMLRNHIQRNKCDYLKYIIKTDRMEWFKNYWEKNNQSYLFCGTKQSINNHIRNSYLELKLKLYENNRLLENKEKLVESAEIGV